jgi:hypothetical protein
MHAAILDAHEAALQEHCLLKQGALGKNVQLVKERDGPVRVGDRLFIEAALLGSGLASA